MLEKANNEMNVLLELFDQFLFTYADKSTRNLAYTYLFHTIDQNIDNLEEPEAANTILSQAGQVIDEYKCFWKNGSKIMLNNRNELREKLELLYAA